MADELAALLERQGERVRAVLNLLVESPYFYRQDNEELFFFLRRYQREFAQFVEHHFGWTLLLDGKCARVYKERWYNQAITEANRDLFGFRRRDDCLAFMMLLEFFELQLEANAMSADDAENLRFRFGDLLQSAHRRFADLLPDKAADYSEDAVRRILREILPVLERYRLIARLRPPTDEEVTEEDLIFEALPALYHYNTTRLAQAVQPAAGELPTESTDDGSNAPAWQ